MKFLLVLSLLCSSAWATLQFSAGFSNDAVLQRSTAAGAAVYGFTDTAAAVTVAVTGTDGKGAAVSYKVQADVHAWTGGKDIHPDTPPPPPHGAFVWRAALKPAAAGGALKITARNGAAVNGTASINGVTHGDVWFCSGQSNMALETFYTFSADMLKAEIAAGKFKHLRHFMFGGMGLHYEATTPQFVTTQNSAAASAAGPADQFVWHSAAKSAALPSMNNATKKHSPWAQFSATCMYFGAELITARAGGADADVPVGLIQSAIGGSQIESWMDNKTLLECKNQSLTGGAIPQDAGALYYGMVAPFANYSVAGWVWYQGENNVHGDMGNVFKGTGYGCSLPAMVRSWREIWAADASLTRLFGVATLAAGGSEGNGQHMAGMRWSETANYGVLPAPAMPDSFLAQVYDIGDPWAAKEKGWSGGDPQNCSLPCDDPRYCAPGAKVGTYGENCTKWDPSKWSAAMKPLAPLIRANDPSSTGSDAGIVKPGINFMGGIHPRLKRPVGRRLAVAAAALLAKKTPMSGPTISGCTHTKAAKLGGAATASAGSLTLSFNLSLLGDDSVLVQANFNNNMSSWSGVDSLTAMVCGSAPPPPHSTSMTCQHKCEAAGHCATGLVSCGQQPSCGQGCMVAAAGASLTQCKAACLATAGGAHPNKNVSHCTFKFKNLTLQTCAGCAKWTPDQKKPPGLSPYANCGQNDVGHCYEGCEYAHGAPPKPLFPLANATVCACQSWGKVACDGGVKGQTNKWPCDPINRPGSSYWYCEDGPGWKPPRALQLREARQRAARTALAAKLGVSVPRPGPNVFATLWTAAPLKAGSKKGTVEVDLSALGAATDVHAVRYAWPLAGDGDTCCPGADVSAGLTVCTPANCPLLSAKSQLPANPFFAKITAAGKCACELPQICDQ